MVKFSPLSERLAGLVPVERVGNDLTRPGGQSGQHARDDGSRLTEAQSAESLSAGVSSASELARAEGNLRSALTRFGREAPGRRAVDDRPQPPGQILDIRV